jgi:RHS repeat-associated protein
MSSATYDGDGLRTSETSTPSGGSQITQNFVWNTISAVPNLLMDSTNAYIFAGSGTPAEQVNLSTGTIVYLVADSLGSVRGAVASSGSLSGSVDYDAWGNPETAGGLGSYTPFGFAGAYTDLSGIVYLIGRYYDPATGQFLTVDPDLQTTHEPYIYASDDPVDNADPLGEAPPVGGLCGTVFGTFRPGAAGPGWTYATIGVTDLCFRAFHYTYSLVVGRRGTKPPIERESSGFFFPGYQWRTPLYLRTTFPPSSVWLYVQVDNYPFGGYASGTAQGVPSSRRRTVKGPSEYGVRGGVGGIPT